MAVRRLYRNSLDGGCPFVAGHADHPFIDLPAPVGAFLKERTHPAPFADHFSQVTLFYRCLTPVEQDHVTAAYTFELSKCYDQTIRERQLQTLANIDVGLCKVADGLGLTPPKPTVSTADVTTILRAAQAAGMVALVIGPHSGKIGKLTVHRTYANAASIEFDALALVG